jgi:hypothetical protein
MYVATLLKMMIPIALYVWRIEKFYISLVNGVLPYFCKRTDQSYNKLIISWRYESMPIESNQHIHVHMSFCRPTLWCPGLISMSFSRRNVSIWTNLLKILTLL